METSYKISHDFIYVNSKFQKWVKFFPVIKNNNKTENGLDNAP